jgi:integrase
VKVPTEEKINLIIGQATTRYATIYHLSKHGLRPDEISKITLRDIDFERGTLLINTSKQGLERNLKLKPEAKDLLKEYVHLNQIIEINKRIFPHSKTIRNGWIKCRHRAYNKFKDPELLKIRLYDLRHWYGTTQYIKTRDIFHVKYLMGHRNIESTLHYMHIAKGLVNYSDEYHVKIASSLEEYTELLETGFEYISDYEDKKILRKRK